MFWKFIPANPRCEHEVDSNGLIEWFDVYEMAHYKAAGFHCCCKHCGGAGHCVNDTGDFWLDGEGDYV